MRRRLPFLFLVTTPLATAVAQSAPPLVLVGVQLVESRRAGPVRATVTIANGVITGIEETDRPRGRPPVGAQVIELQGRYLIPGLWDMHVHTTAAVGGPPQLVGNPDYFFPLFVRHGVVGVRDMSGDLPALVRWRDDIAAGRRLGPRLVVTGGKVGQWERPVAPGAGPIRSDGDVAAALDALIAGGADFIKAEGMDMDRLRLVATLGRERGRPVVGHVAETSFLAEAAELGMKSVEHLHGAVAGCSAVEAEVVARARRSDGWWEGLMVRLGIWSRAKRYEARSLAAVEAPDAARCRALAARLVAAGTWLTPTLGGLRAVASPTPVVDSTRSHLLPAAVTRRHLGPFDETLAARRFARQRAVFKQLLDAGVPMLAGTDAPGTGRIPGSSLLDELAAMVAAGATPRQALYAATEGPARFLGLEATAGAIEVGRRADLVVLEGNPLEDITRLRLVAGVVLGGRWLPPTELDRLEREVAALVARWNEAPR
ncbi:MAG: amidohydrolase family protein [Gemmatimonadales bacterium]